MLKNLFQSIVEESKTAKVDMESEWHFSYAFSAIDGSHLPIKCPKRGREAMKQYYNFKKFYSKILLALVDARYRFTWVRVGTPGNIYFRQYLFSIYRSLGQN